MNSYQIETAMLVEYGIHPTVEAVTRLTRLGTRPIETERDYVRVCRRLARLRGDDAWGAHDARLIAVGFNHVRPSEWVADGLVEFVRYWTRAVRRPETIGSSHNAVTPSLAWQARCAGIPAHVVRALGELPLQRWLLRRDGTIPRRVTRARLQTLARAARAARRTSMRRELLAAISLRALATLGRVSPETQRAMLLKLGGPPDHPFQYRLSTAGTRMIKNRDLPWDVGARVSRQIAADATGRVRVAWASGQRMMSLVQRHRPGLGTHAGFVLGSEIAAWLSPSYPTVPWSIAQRLCRGESPQEISSGLLTRAEAHRWLAAGGHCAPQEFLQRQLPEECPLVRSVLVARWLLEVESRGRWTALTRYRTIAGPRGELRQIRFIDRIDEIQDEDLVQGVSTSVVAAFEAAARRVAAAMTSEFRDDHTELQRLPRGWRLYRCMQHLRTPAELVREGETMRHCVGSYVGAVSSGQSVILSIRLLGQASTVELTPEGRVLQHHGIDNGPAPELCRRVLNRFLERRIPQEQTKVVDIDFTRAFRGVAAPMRLAQRMG